MLRLGAERDELSVVGDQLGSPTYAGDLAEVILEIINSKSINFGLYHYSNSGTISWYEFTKAIFNLAQIDCNVCPINTSGYPTPAKRPPYSVMDKSKIKSSFNLEIPYWRDNLSDCIKKLIAD